MKLASLAALNGSDHGARLVVVSEDLHWCADAGHIVATLQAALADWSWAEPALRALALDLEMEAIPRERFHEREALAPLASDAMLAARAPLEAGESAVRPELIGVLDGLAQGASASEARAQVRLIGLVVRGEHSAHCSPVLLTAESLSDAESGELPALMVRVEHNGSAAAYRLGASDFGAIAAALAQSQTLAAGTVVPQSHAEAAIALSAADTLRIEARDAAGHSLFGAIELQAAMA